MVSHRVTFSESDQTGMMQMPVRPVRKIDPSRLAALLDRLHWDDLHLLSNMSQQPSIRKASQSLGIAPNTIRARISRMERTIDALLFVRSREGLHLTPDGEALLDVAQEMKLKSAAISFGEGNNALVKSGEIRICASEGLGTFWLTPRLLALKSALPDLLVSLDSYADQEKLHPRNHDVAIGFVRPEDPDVIVSRLGFVHMIPFASEDYLRRKGNPGNFDEALGHHCVQQDAPGLNYEALRLFFGQDRMDSLTSYRVSSSYSLFWAVASGVGIGALPTYIRSMSKRVIPVRLPIQLKFEIWMSYSRVARDSKPVRTAINWLRDCFDPELFPWFREAFVHPEAFSKTHADSQVIPLFDHLIDDPA